MATLTTSRVSEQEQGQLAGVNAALSGLMAALGPLWAGMAYDHVFAGSPYLIAALIVSLACVLTARLRVGSAEQKLVDVYSAAD